MDVWNTLKRQIATLWRQWSVQQRIGISTAAIMCLAAVVGTFIWATQPEYVVLHSAASHHEAATIAGTLEAEQIAYNLSFSGTVLFVSRGDVARARLALKDVLDPLAIDESAAGSPMFPGTESAERDQKLRRLEARIKHTIEQLNGIRTATVHISQPNPSPFVIEQEAPTASIIVVPASPRSMTRKVAQSVIKAVAGAVEGLVPENVSLTDNEGNDYALSDGLGGDMLQHFEYQRRLEFTLEQKAESMLHKLLGEGKAYVTVSAEIDTREVKRTEHIVDPDSKAKIQETLETVKSEGGAGPQGEPAGAGGTAGIQGNVRPPLPAAPNGAKFTSENTTTTYETASTSETVVETPGTIKRLTVAVVADLGSGGSDENTDAPQVATEDVEAIVKQAVGFNSSRGDEIKVQDSPINVPVYEPEVPGFMPLYQEYKPLIEAVLVGLGATVAFFMAVLALRKLRPVIAQEDTEPGFNRDDYERMAELSRKARSNPEIAARILSTWLNQESKNESPETEVPRNSRAA